jgi:cytochrome c oxidase assembly protein Cox11
MKGVGDEVVNEAVPEVHLVLLKQEVTTMFAANRTKIEFFSKPVQQMLNMTPGQLTQSRE